MKLRWTDRHFTFDLPEGLFPVVVERLRGIPERIEDKVRGLSADVLTQKPRALIPGRGDATLQLSHYFLRR
ncbi:MAG TPA: hypothetical protein VGG03_16045 [Thermoanaerobaculia bacterium]|jgi:hypothetical protein